MRGWRLSTLESLGLLTLASCICGALAYPSQGTLSIVSAVVFLSVFLAASIAVGRIGKTRALAIAYLTGLILHSTCSSCDLFGIFPPTRDFLTLIANEIVADDIGRQSGAQELDPFAGVNLRAGRFVLIGLQCVSLAAGILLAFIVRSIYGEDEVRH